MATTETKATQSPSLFRPWVPKWLGGLMYFFIFFPALFLSGAYGSNAADMMSGLGIISEHIMMATFAAAIGLVVAGPYLLTVLQAYSPRFIYLAGLPVMVVLNIICGYTESMLLLILCSFLMGIVRVFVMINSLFGILSIIAGANPLDMLGTDPNMSPEEIAKKNRGRGVMQAASYLVFLSIGQLGSYLTAKMAYEYRWQYAYWYVAAFVLIALLLVLVLMQPLPSRLNVEKKPVPPVGKALTAALFFGAFCYVLVYGKTYDWFSDWRISLAGGLMLVAAGTFILQHTRNRRRLIDPHVFTAPSVVTAMVFFTLVMVLNSSSSLLTAFMGMSMKLDSVQTVAIGNWQFLGFVLAFIVNVTLLVKGGHSRWFIAGGFACITLSSIVLYFQYQTMATYESLILPTVLRSMGMWMVYAYCGSYGMNHIDVGRQLGSWVFVMLMFRAVVGPVAGSALYSNAVYHRSQQHFERYAQELDSAYPMASASFQRTQMGTMMQGKSYEEASQMAAMNSRGGIQQQVMLVTLKEMTGWTIYGGVACIVLALVFPYNGIRRKGME